MDLGADFGADGEGFGICCSCSVRMGISVFQDTKLSLKPKILGLGFGMGEFSGRFQRVGAKLWCIIPLIFLPGDFPSADFPSRCQGRGTGTPQLGN